MPVYVNTEVREYHTYWVKPLAGNILICMRDPQNRFDRFAVRVENQKGQIIGHLAAKPLPVNKAMSYMIANRKVEISW